MTSIDTRYDEAVRLVISTGKASASLLQRSMRIGFSDAARLLDRMEAAGIISAIDAGLGRTVLVPSAGTAAGDVIRALLDEVERSRPPAVALGVQPIHDWFGLSYAAYLVLPRALLQSAAPAWQHKFVTLLKELNDTFQDELPKGAVGYRVWCVDDRGRRVSDPLSDYRYARVQPRAAAADESNEDE